MGPARFWATLLVIIAVGIAATRLVDNQYYFVAGYRVLQFVVLATAWNILGGYTGYVNFGSGAFFAMGAYAAVVLIKTVHAPLGAQILGGAAVSGLVGLGMGYLTLRLRGIFFAIATLALSVVLLTFVTNWDFVGGSRGVYVVPPPNAPLFAGYSQFLFVVMLMLAAGAVALARAIERSRIGHGLAAIRDDEQAAECMGVPTLRLKLLAAATSGALMGAAGAPFPYYLTYLEPTSTFGLEYAVNSIAMPLIGGTMSWLGPLVGALLLGTVQQVATVTISSELNLLIVGVLLILFVTLAPEGIVGLVRRLSRSGSPG